MIINRGSFVFRSTMVESSRVGSETTDMGRTSKLEQSQKPKENDQRGKQATKLFSYASGESFSRLNLFPE